MTSEFGEVLAPEGVTVEMAVTNGFMVILSASTDSAGTYSLPNDYLPDRTVHGSCSVFISSEGIETPDVYVDPLEGYPLVIDSASSGSFIELYFTVIYPIAS